MKGVYALLFAASLADDAVAMGPTGRSDYKVTQEPRDTTGAGHVIEGKIYFENGHYFSAAHSFIAALRIKRTASRYLILGDSFLEIGDPDAALGAYNESALMYEAKGDSAQVRSIYTHMANISYDLGDLVDAEKLLGYAIEFGSIDAHYRLGMVQEDLDKPNEAVKSFQRYLDLAPNGKYRKSAKEGIMMNRPIKPGNKPRKELEYILLEELC